MFVPDNSLQIDHAQVAQQLELLGYAPGEKVFLRAFYPSDNPHKSEDRGRKAEEITVESIVKTAQAFQRSGRGIYLVVNGFGHKDSAVLSCRAIFYEHDNLSKQLQLHLWRSLGLPEPTFQVDTGGKSIHSYWIFDQPLDPIRWKSLQTDLLELADADRSLKNPSRVMRLAGGYHISAKGVHPTTIVSASGNRYSFEELRAKIPTSAPSLLPELSQNVADVPLAMCLSRSDRELLIGGVGEGGRNTEGAKLARNLIGTSMRLQCLGIQHSENPRQLFETYCDRCSPPLDAREADQIWKSAESSNPIATLSDEAIENCVKAWQRKSQVQPSRSGVNAGQTHLNIDEPR